MSSQAVFDRIDDIFEHPEQFNPEKMGELIQETLKFFEELRGQFESKDEAVRDQALKQAIELKEKLSAQALALCKTAGMEPEALEVYMNNPTHFTQEEWTAIEKAKTDIQEYEKVVGIDRPKKKPSKKRARVAKNWIVG